MPAREIRFRDVTFAYPRLGDVRARPRAPCDHFDLTIPAGSSLAIVGQNGAGKTTLAKLLCRLYDPQAGAIEVDGVDLREFDLESWRSRVAAVFQDFIRFELPLRDNVAPAGAPDDVVRAALEAAGATDLAALDTVLRAATPAAPTCPAGSGSASRWRARWRRQARRRRRAARRADRAARRARRGGDLRAHPRRDPALHDDPDLASLLDRAARRSHLRARARPGHRARHARRADGAGGRYRTMFDLQAQRFGAPDEEEGARMTSSPDRDRAIEPLPPALSSMWRLCKLGYRHEPRLMVVAFVLSQLAALPDALLALWLKLLGNGVARAPAAASCWSRRSGSAYRPPRPGFCARSARACSGGSATR